MSGTVSWGNFVQESNWPAVKRIHNIFTCNSYNKAFAQHKLISMNKDLEELLALLGGVEAVYDQLNDQILFNLRNKSIDQLKNLFYRIAE